METELFETVKSTINEIENNLHESNKTGVFFSPELYVAFCIGKDIAKRRELIFGTTNIEWQREIDLGNGGPSDIIFKNNENYTVIELKLRGTYDSYKADIEKLKRLKIPSKKYFCVLLDSFTKNNDVRLLKLEQEYKDRLTKIGHYSFPTWNNWYQRQIYCNLNLYRID